MVDKLLMEQVKNIGQHHALLEIRKKIYHLLSGKRSIILFSLFLVFPPKAILSDC
jgi:hypothetical protein